MPEVFALLETIPLLVASLLVVLSIASLWWTTRKSRRILSRLLNRPLREGEETSLSSWMQVSDDQLDAGSRELMKDPFGRPEGWLRGMVERGAHGPDALRIERRD